MFVTKKFTFSAAHFLTKYKGKCENLHGHTYKLTVTVEGDMKDDGMVIDFVELKKIVNERVIDKLDHSSLNDLFENPTAELIAKWVWEQLGDIPGARLYEVKLWESSTSSVTYRGQ
jgi:6-pyruvoyltetrahydropterin/6-carboxytetrahydropterin synthase